MLTDGEKRSVHVESDLFFRFVRSGHVDPWKSESQSRTWPVAPSTAGAPSAGGLDLGCTHCVIECEPRRLWCRDCGARYEAVPWARSGSH
jgi:hypothetical protein